MPPITSTGLIRQFNRHWLIGEFACLSLSNDILVSQNLVMVTQSTTNLILSDAFHYSAN